MSKVIVKYGIVQLKNTDLCVVSLNNIKRKKMEQLRYEYDFQVKLPKGKKHVTCKIILMSSM